MKNLQEEELKKSFEKEIKNAINKMKNPNADITIKFTDETPYHCKSSEKIKISLGSIYFKDVNLSILGKETAIKLIVNNLYYNYFAYIDTDIIIGEPRIQGHGEYWGTDKIIIHYHRLNEKNEF